MTEIVVKKHRGQSAEHMAKIRALRKDKSLEENIQIVSASPIIPETFPPTQKQAFMIEEVEAVGGTLFQLVLITLVGDKVFARMPLTHADTKAATLNQLRLKAYMFYFEERMPEARSEGVDANVSA